MPRGIDVTHRGLLLLTILLENWFKRIVWVRMRAASPEHLSKYSHAAAFSGRKVNMILDPYGFREEVGVKLR